MKLEIRPIVAYAVLIVFGVLVFALIRGCNVSKKALSDQKRLMGLVDSFAADSKRAVSGWAKSKKSFQDSLEFERGQKSLVEAQKERTEYDLDKAHQENKELLEKYNLQRYADTSMVSAPSEFIHDCHDCFKRLDITDKLSMKYKNEIKEWGLRFKRETSVLEGRTKEVERERDVYYNQVDSFRKAHEKVASKIEPRGRLYLSWGVLWSPLPVAAGGGLMYQNKRNLIYGLKGYYGKGGTTIETTINFPLSLKFK